MIAYHPKTDDFCKVKIDIVMELTLLKPMIFIYENGFEGNFLAESPRLLESEDTWLLCRQLPVKILNLE